MNIEIQKPELEALIEQRMASGAFNDVEAVLLHALKSAPLPEAPTKPSPKRTGADIVAAIQKMPRSDDEVQEPDQEEQEPKQNLADFLLNSPLHGSGIVVERSKDAPRIIEF